LEEIIEELQSAIKMKDDIISRSRYASENLAQVGTQENTALAMKGSMSESRIAYPVAEDLNSGRAPRLFSKLQNERFPETVPRKGSRFTNKLMFIEESIEEEEEADDQNIDIKINDEAQRDSISEIEVPEVPIIGAKYLCLRKNHSSDTIKMLLFSPSSYENRKKARTPNLSILIPEKVAFAKEPHPEPLHYGDEWIPKAFTNLKRVPSILRIQIPKVLYERVGNETEILLVGDEWIPNKFETVYPDLKASQNTLTDEPRAKGTKNGIKGLFQWTKRLFKRNSPSQSAMTIGIH
jgi:hypothetical protein